MRKFLLTILAALAILTLVSCDTYAQTVITDDGFVYEYSYNNYPVRYINGTAYYYGFCNNTWAWIIIPDIYVRYIIHHPRPLRFNYGHYHHHRPYVVNNHGHHRPGGHITRPTHSRDNGGYNRPNPPRNNGNFGRNPGVNRPSHPGGNHGGGRHFGGRR